MDKSLRLDVVTPDRILMSDDIESIIVPAAEGYLGVLYNHAPMIVGLNPGAVKYRKSGKSNYLAIGGGFVEIANNKITLLADSAERPDEIDKERAEDAKERAEKRLKEKPPGLDVQRAELALKRALSRLKVKGYVHR